MILNVVHISISCIVLVESVVEILVDPLVEEDIPLGHSIVEHSSITTSVQSHGEYKTSCVKVIKARYKKLESVNNLYDVVRRLIMRLRLELCSSINCVYKIYSLSVRTYNIFVHEYLYT